MLGKQPAKILTYKKQPTKLGIFSERYFETETVRVILKELDPQGVEARRSKTLHCRVYYTPGQITCATSMAMIN